MDPVEVLGRAFDVHVESAEMPILRDVLADLGRVGSAIEARRIAVRRRIEDLARAGVRVEPDRELTDAGNSSSREASLNGRRSQALELVPAMEEPLAHGEVTPAHVDALANGLGQLDTKDRERFAGDRGAELAELAKSQSPDQYAKSVKQAIEDAQSDAGIGKLERQKRAKRFRTWWDKVTGMLQLSGQIDPETGMQFAAKLGAEVEQMFHGQTPEGCPEDPSAKQDYLMALALIQLVLGHTAPADGGGDGGAVPETGTNADFVVVIGLEILQRGRDAGSIIDLNDPETSLPVETLRRMACLANIIPAVMDSNGVVLDMGYSARLATKAQRRAMRAMYPSCGVPGCRVPFARCAIHHIRYWEDFGTSDMANMIPLCSKHHHAAHEGGWHLALDPVTRALTIIYPDGSRHTTAAPRARAPAA